MVSINEQLDFLTELNYRVSMVTIGLIINMKYPY